MPKKTLYLHVGTGKTGTTYLQWLLANNDKYLEEIGLYYPSFYGRVANTHHNLVYGMNGDPRFSLNFNPNNVWKRLVKEIDNTEANRVLVSSEFFWALGPKALHQEVSKYFDDIKVIVYVRRQYEWLESAFAQRIKVPRFKDYKVDQTITALNKTASLDSLLGSWELFFGKDSIILKTFEKSDNDLFLDFISIFDLNVESANIKGLGMKVNKSLELYQLSFLSSLNKYSISGKVREILYSKSSQVEFFDLYEKNVPESMRPNCVLSHETKNKFYEKFIKSNMNVAERYFNRKELFNSSADVSNNQILNEKEVTPLSENITLSLISMVSTL